MMATTSKTRKPRQRTGSTDLGQVMPCDLVIVHGITDHDREIEEGITELLKEGREDRPSNPGAAIGARWRPHPGHPGTTLPKDWKPDFWEEAHHEPEEAWTFYPCQGVLPSTTRITLLASKRCWATVQLQRQDGRHVCGADWSYAEGGGGHAPDRKWGDWPTREAAERYGWEHLLDTVESSIRCHRLKSPKGQPPKYRELFTLAAGIRHRLATLNGGQLALTFGTPTP